MSIRVFAEWDAGGDSTPCRAYPNPGEEDYWKSEDRPYYEELGDRIVDALRLPNAGERYHAGRGEIFLGKKNEIFLRFTSREYEFASDFDIEDNRLLRWENTYHSGRPVTNRESQFTRTHVFEKPFDIGNILHRAELQLTGEMDLAGNKQANVILRMINGDEVVLSQEAEAFYKKKILEVLAESESLLRGRKKDSGGLFISGELEADGSVHFLLDTRAYDVLNLHSADIVSLSNIKDPWS